MCSNEKDDKWTMSICKEPKEELSPGKSLGRIQEVVKDSYAVVYTYYNTESVYLLKLRNSKFHIGPYLTV